MIPDKTVFKTLYTFFYMEKGISEIIFLKYASELWNIKKCRVQILLIRFIHLWFLPSDFQHLHSKKARKYGLCWLFIFFIVTIWRKERDSNPRYAINVYTSSSRAPSTSSAIFPHIKLKIPQHKAEVLNLVRVTGLEPVRQWHTPLKRACLPIPAHSHWVL